jgi:hypothetical protein
LHLCRAVKKLLASDQLAVASENTILVALTGWLEAHARSRSSGSGSGNTISIPGSSYAGAAGGSAEAGQQQQPQQHLPVQHCWGAGANAAQQLQQQHKELAELVSRADWLAIYGPQCICACVCSIVWQVLGQALQKLCVLPVAALCPNQSCFWVAGSIV